MWEEKEGHLVEWCLFVFSVKLSNIQAILRLWPVNMVSGPDNLVMNIVSKNLYRQGKMTHNQLSNWIWSSDLFVASYNQHGLLETCSNPVSAQGVTAVKSMWIGLRMGCVIVVMKLLACHTCYNVGSPGLAPPPYGRNTAECSIKLNSLTWRSRGEWGSGR